MSYCKPGRNVPQEPASRGSDIVDYLPSDARVLNRTPGYSSPVKAGPNPGSAFETTSVVEEDSMSSLCVWMTMTRKSYLLVGILVTGEIKKRLAVNKVKIK